MNPNFETRQTIIRISEDSEYKENMREKMKKITAIVLGLSLCSVVSVAQADTATFLSQIMNKSLSNDKVSDSKIR